MTPRWAIAGGALLGVLVAAHGAAALTGDGGSSGTLETWAYNIVIACSALGCVARAWLVREDRREWMLIGSGLTALAVGELWLELAQGSYEIADGAFVVFYLLTGAGLWSLYRQHWSMKESWFWLDALTGVLTVTAIWAAASMEPLAAATSEQGWRQFFDVAYPLGDLLLLLVVVVGLAGRGWRADRRIALLGSGLFIVAIADTVYAWQGADGNYLGGTILDTAWPLATLFIAAAAWQRSPPPAEAPLGARQTLLPAVFAGVSLTVVTLHSVVDYSDIPFALAIAATVSAIARSLITSAGYIRMLAFSEKSRSALRDQTARARASEAGLEEVNRLARFGRWEWDLATDYVTGSPELYRLMELGEPRSIPFRNITRRLHHEDYRWVRETLRDAVRRGEPFDFDERFILHDGSELVFHVRGAVDREGNRVYGSAQDVTGRYRAERALRETEVLFRKAFNDAPLGMSLLRPDGSWLRINDAYRELLGYSESELSGKTFLDVTHPDDVAGDRMLMERALRGGPDSYSRNKRYIHRDGRVLTVNFHASLVRDEQGAPMYFVAHLEDVTERERGREALERLAAIVEASHDAIFSTGEADQVTSWNPACARLFGIDVLEAIGQQLGDLLGEEFAAADEVIWGDRHLSVTKADVRNDDGEPVGCSYVARDATAQVEKRELEAKLHQTERLESLGTLAGGIAHDFNNLLAVILNYADFLIDDTEDDRTRDDLRELRAAADRGAQLTRQLLLFTRRGLSRPEVFELDRHIRGVERLLARTIGEDVELEVSLDARDVEVELDPSELDQVLMNLAVNSRHAMPHGGKLSITTTLRADHAVVLRVCDTGVGMAPEVAERALEPFFTTKEGGTGLGLATVYGVATRAGGSAEIQSTPGAGTEVRVVLPLASDSVVLDERGQGVRRDESPTAGASVLVVEDDAPVREAARRILSRSGYTVACASNAEQALAMARRKAPDVVLTDVVMPGMAGTMLAERLRDLEPAARVVFMTGYSEDVVLRNGLARGAVDLVRKPFDAETLESAVGAALTR